MLPDRICAGRAIGSKGLRRHISQPNYCGNEYPRIGWKKGPAETGSSGRNPRAEQGSRQPGPHARRKPCSAVA